MPLPYPLCTALVNIQYIVQMTCENAKEEETGALMFQ